MDTEGTYGARHGAVPRPMADAAMADAPMAEPVAEVPRAGVPVEGLPRPRAVPGDAPPPPPFITWLRAPRAAPRPGVWAYEHRPRPPREPGRVPGRQLVSGAVIAFLCGWLLWSLLWNGFLGPYWTWPLRAMMPGSWDQSTRAYYVASYAYYALFMVALAVVFGRIGRWPELGRRYFMPLWRRAAERLLRPAREFIAARWPRLLVRARPELIPTRELAVRAGLAFAGVWVVWALCWNGVVGDVWMWPLETFAPESWRRSVAAWLYASYTYYVLFTLFLLAIARRVGHWRELMRRYGGEGQERYPGPKSPKSSQGKEHSAPQPRQDPAEWPQLRAHGAHDAADRLTADAWGGRMNDVDHARIEHAWQSVQQKPSRLAGFTDTVLRHGAAAYRHPSGERDLPQRTARHDLVTAQVRIGTAADEERNPYAHRDAGCALDPSLLGTSLLAVGPPGCGKTERLVRPVLESLCLQALAGRASVVAVGAAGSALAPDDAFDVVVKIGRPDSAYDLDLYGGTEDPDEAAAVLAEGLAGDLADGLPGSEGRRVATALAQLLGPFRAVHGRFPSVPELRELLDGSADAVRALREALTAEGHEAHLRELDARERQSQRPGDPGPLLADRLALLDRPAFARFFDTTDPSRTFSLRAVEHPVRVRIDLPERGHAEASRMLARLVLAQFTECAAGRGDRSLFACLVLDDATHTITPDAVRGLGRLRSANAGAVLTLRTLDDVPEALRPALLGSVGCRMAFSGVTTWDGARFAEVWGKEWVETRDVTDRQIIAHEPFTRAMHIVRHLVTGRAVTAQSVTVRRVERERWSASELAHAVPAGHAVLSVTSVRGDSAPPVLVDLTR
ncbi:ATP/GTP-binding protein [Streptomyces sp. NPDC052396]|uniref:ATP/GTP-binding protein n=1 Tax=Streptomyces sp. NPDC052396 TaxID=3365689 RepID=UPI0037D8DC08